MARFTHKHRTTLVVTFGEPGRIVSTTQSKDYDDSCMSRRELRALGDIECYNRRLRSGRDTMPSTDSIRGRDSAVGAISPDVPRGVSVGAGEHHHTSISATDGQVGG